MRMPQPAASMNGAFGRLRLGIVCASVMLMAALSPRASVASPIYVETGDAAQSIAGAQQANTQPGGTALDAIQGFLEAGGADVFKIYLTGGQTFSATTSGSSLAFNNFDTQLFLFNSAGLGVSANDDDLSSPPQSTLPDSISLTPTAAGIYYLAIAGSGFLPLSGGGFIFPELGGLLDQSGGIQNAVGPTGPGGALALSGWNSTSSETGDYEIKLTGAQFLPADTAPVPEPSALILLGTGLAFVRRRARRRR